MIVKENEININDEVYVVRKFGTLKDGFDVQIIKYKVKYKGKTAFVPYGFQSMLEKYQEIDYDICSKTLEEAQQCVKLMLNNAIGFVEKYNGSYYDVVFRE